MIWHEVLNWASKKRAEDEPNAVFYWTKTAKRLLFKLQNEQSAFIGLLGLSGIGKSHTLYAVKNEIEEKLRKINDPQKRDEFYVVSFKWANQPLWDVLQDDFSAKRKMDKSYEKEIWDAYFQTPKGIKQFERVKEDILEKRRLHNWEDIYKDIEKDVKTQIKHYKTEFAEAEKNVAAKTRQEIKEQVAFDILSAAEVIFIDFPDYGRTDSRLLNRDLTHIGALWSKLRADYSRCHIVVSIQKELLEKGGHFTVGKMDILTIEPLKPEELLDFYKQHFKTTEPFSEDASLLLAYLSRGIYRRFKKYIQTCIESVMEERLVTVEDIKIAITEDQLIKDMELELSNLFTQHLHRAQAVKTINYIRERGECNQKDIAEFLNVSEATAGKLINKLVAYDYLQRKRGEGNTWLVSIKI